MLASKLYHIRCHSSLDATARRRYTVAFYPFVDWKSQTLQAQAQNYARTVRWKHVNVPVCAPIGRCHAPSAAGSAHLSTTVPLWLPSRNRNVAFLKPQGKPKFRVRSEKENEEFLQALKEAQDEYTTQIAEGEQEKGHHLEDEPHRIPGLDADDTLTSPFFAIPDVQPSDPSDANELQPGLNTPDDRWRRLPKLTRFSRREAETTELERELYYLSHNDPHPTAIHSILQILIRGRKIKPAAHHYEALILANTWPEYGSVSSIERIIAEMITEGIEIGASTIAAVLKALAVHPSMELSHRVLEMVERRWIQLSPQTHHHRVTAMIRSGQTELAAWTLDVLKEAQKPLSSKDREVIPDYLVVLLIAELVKKQDWEGILRYFYKLRSRRAADREIPVAFWGWLLDCASKSARTTTQAALFESGPTHQSASMDPPDSETSKQLILSMPAYHLTCTLFTLYVAPMSLQPSWTTLLNILHSAANTGTAWLAESVLATMTYLDGIDTRGRPIAFIPQDIIELVDLAKRRAKDNEDRKLAAETEEEKATRREEEDQKAETEKQKIEIDQWYEKLMTILEKEEKETVANDNAAEDGGKDSQTPTNQSISHLKSLPPDTSNAINASRSHSSQPPPQGQNYTKSGDISSVSPLPSPAIVTTNDVPYEVFDPSTVPAGNLWPLFPKIDGVRSAHVDPWETLGPKSSARRKWTEAQERFKRIGWANRKKV